MVIDFLSISQHSKLPNHEDFDFLWNANPKKPLSPSMELTRIHEC